MSFGVSMLYREAGIERAIFEVPSSKAHEVLPILDRCAALARKCR